MIAEWKGAALIFIFCASLGSSLGANPEFAFRAVGMTYLGAVPDGDKELSWALGGNPEKVTVNILAENAKVELIEVDNAGIGRDVEVRFLTRQGNVPLRNARISAWSFPKISVDGRKAIFDIIFERMPPEAATGIEIEGTFRAVAGKRLAILRSGKVLLKTGTSFRLGPMAVHLMKAEGNMFRFKTDGKYSLVKSLRLLDDQGKELPAKGGPKSWQKWQSSAMPGMYEVEYKLENSIPALSLEADYWEKTELIERPFRIAVQKPF